MARKRKKKRSTYLMNPLLERIRIAQPETKDFPYKIGDEEFIITVRQFKPGTAMRLRKTAMIKIYKVVKAEAVPLSRNDAGRF